MEKPDFGPLTAMADTDRARLTLTFTRGEYGSYKLAEAETFVHGYGDAPDSRHTWYVPSGFPMSIGSVQVIEGESEPGTVTVFLDASDRDVLRTILRLAKSPVNVTVYGDNRQTLRTETGYVSQLVAFHATIGKRKGGTYDNITLTVESTTKGGGFGVVRYR